MKKVLSSILAIVSTAALFGASAKPYFSIDQFQAASQAADEVLVTFPLVYKGSMKITGNVSIANFVGGDKDSCAVYEKSFSVPLYMTMCQPCIEKYPCDWIPVFKDGEADSMKNVTKAEGVLLPNHPEISVSLLKNSYEPGNFNAAITSWNIYAVIPYKDIVNIFKKNPYADPEQKTCFPLGDYIKEKKSILMKQDLRKIDNLCRNFFTGNPSGEASVYWDSQISTNVKNFPRTYYTREDLAFLSNLASFALSGKKSYYSFPAVPSRFSDVGGNFYEWLPFGNGNGAVTNKIQCVKSFKGYFIFQKQDLGGKKADARKGAGEVYCDENKAAVGAGVAYGNVTLTLNSLTKTVANRIFGGTDTSQPTICEEGLAAFSDINKIDDSYNVFEEAAFGKKLDKSLVLKDVSRPEGSNLYLWPGVGCNIYLTYFLGDFEGVFMEYDDKNLNP